MRAQKTFAEIKVVDLKFLQVIFCAPYSH